MSGFVPGLTARLTVEVEGRVDAVTADTVTIAGHVLPTRLDGAVQTISTEPTFARVRVSASDDECDELHCDDCDGDCCDLDHCGDGCQSIELLRAIDVAHLDHHDGPVAYCADPICTAVREATR